MARIHDLIRQLAGESPDLARELEREIDVLSERRAFGLNFERHTPEEVELPGRPVRRGDKVHVLPPRGETPKAANAVMWVVDAVDWAAGTATVGRDGPKGTVETRDVAVADLVVVAEFRDPIYPGLESTGSVERGGDKPYHSVINGENFHALQTLLFTHRGKVDVIYIDPPYNTGARDWKYNNDYVESDDQYRHSKWLAFMERRLLLAKELLNPDESVLIVTIDEKEYLRLGQLLEQVLPEGALSMVSSIINPAGAGRASDFSRTDEYLFFVRIGDARILPEQRDEERRPVTWDTLRRSDLSSVRPTRPGQFYPIYVSCETGRIESIGEPLVAGVPREQAPPQDGCAAVFPVRPDGTEMNWGITAGTARDRLAAGYLRAGKYSPTDPQSYAISYLTGGIIRDIQNGGVEVTGRAADGSVIAQYVTGRLVMPTTAWNKASHDAQRYGTEILKSLIPDRRFPFPKALYAVEDSLRHVIKDKPHATVVDFFAGSGTTAHAVMRLNKQDGGRRVSIAVTNNEVSAREQDDLRKKGLRPGDPDWEQCGICAHITKARIQAAITGQTPGGEPIKGDYKFTDEFPMADGFVENVEFFTLTYEAPLRVASRRAFPKIAPLLWLRAGSVGRRIESLDAGWDVADTYGVLEDLDKSDEFLTAVAAAPDVRLAFVITGEDRLFEAIVRDLPEHVEPVRMYDAYLRNFELESRVPR
jgi:adenine-specific DNA-methyltransferase